MEDLDSLLEDLGRPKSTAQRQPRAPSSRVDLNELEDLMDDLAAPSARSSSTSVNDSYIPSSSNGFSSNDSPSGGGELDDLDALMDSLNTPSSKSSVAPTPTNNLSMDPVLDDFAPSISPVVITELDEPSNGVTDDLDDLLGSLTPSNTLDSSPSIDLGSLSRPSQSYSQSPTKAVGGSDLDSLLNNLTTQMDDIDSDNPASRGICNKCKQPILGEVIQALGKTFHPECFSCGNCRTPLGTGNFFEQGDQPTCEKCYQELFCPRCAHCDEPILGRCITALGKKWHLDHFICTQCLKPFEGGNFYERDGRPYCEQDFYSVFASRCASCDQVIKGDCINALGSQWHPEHFVCQYCKKSFGSGTFYEHGGMPYCEEHYHLQTGALCAGCGKSVQGRSVNALGKKWHPEHFVCAFCMNPLAGGSFTEQNGKAYCKECHGKLFS